MPLDNSSNFFKVNNSSITGIGVEYVTVSEGRFYDFTLGSFFEGSREYYDLAQRATAVFDQGNFIGLQAGGSDYGRSESIIPPEDGGPFVHSVERPGILVYRYLQDES
jgi:hypothetical protein